MIYHNIRVFIIYNIIYINIYKVYLKFEDNVVKMNFTHTQYFCSIRKTVLL
jgi:hypothetical protein